MPQTYNDKGQHARGPPTHRQQPVGPHAQRPWSVALTRLPGEAPSTWFRKPCPLGLFWQEAPAVT